MNKLDFLSEPPQMQLFQNESNKTSFGAILSIIYIFFVTSLSIIHILDFILNDHYEVYYSLKKNYVSEKEMRVDDEMDPLLNFSINIYGVNEDLDQIEASDAFMIIDYDFNLIERNSIIQRRPSELMLYVLYFDFFDEINKENNSTEEDDLNSWYALEIKYQGFKLQHQKSIPIITNESDIYFSKKYLFSINKTTINVIDWEILKYIENRGIYGLFDGILKRKNEYTSGYLASHYSTTRDKPRFNDLKVLLLLQIENRFKQYSEFIRKKNDILDLIANIGSLFSSFFSVFVFIFKFYSKNIDNYQIIEK